MRYLIFFLFSSLFAFKNDLYLTLIKNNLIINYLNNSIYKTKNLSINPQIKTIISTSPDKFIIGNMQINSKGDKKASVGIEFDFQKNIKKIVLSDNKDIFKLNSIFQKNYKTIECYKNQTLFNLKLYFLQIKKYDNFYSKFISLLKNSYPCLTKQNIIFFKLKKEKNFNNLINFNISKKREITSKLTFNINQNTNTYLSASFDIKIPLQKDYSQEDLNKLQNLNTSLNKINLLTLKINNLIDLYKEILKENRDILIKLKLLTFIAKIAPANLNYENLINLYKTFFNNLEKLNNTQQNIFINKFLLKIEKRKVSEY